jgi:hypothetical protein
MPLVNVLCFFVSGVLITQGWQELSIHFIERTIYNWIGFSVYLVFAVILFITGYVV